MDTPIVKNRFTPSQRVLSPKGIHPAQQQFKSDADLNSIMKKYQKTQSMDHVNIYSSEYGFASPTDYHQAMNTVIKAEQLFGDLPSSIRNRFKNNPAEFLEFVQNDENLQEAQELGLTTIGAVTAPEPSGTAKPGEVPVGGLDPATGVGDPPTPTTIPSPS